MPPVLVQGEHSLRLFPWLCRRRLSSGPAVFASLLSFSEWRWALVSGLPVLRRQYSLNHFSGIDHSN